jgi:hypothetical protein
MRGSVRGTVDAEKEGYYCCKSARAVKWRKRSFADIPIMKG